jgi:hypothetical protein
MRNSLVAAAFAASVLAGGCDHHPEVEGPSGLAYACADGRSANIRFDGGDPNRSPARLTLGEREFEMRPVPAMSGLRYQADEGLAPGRALIWSTEGDAAALSEAGLYGSVGETEIVRCNRVREGLDAPADAHGSHGEDH